MKPSIVLCSHDAGGANLLVSWALAHPEFCYWGLLSGPAIEIYNDSSLKFKAIESTDNLPEGLESFVCSTGWQSNWEQKAIKHCIDNKIDVSVYLDHWVNFRVRLVLSGRLLVPNRIWVVDAEARTIACQALPEVAAVNVVGNYYENNIVKIIEQYPEVDPTSVLVCLEPIRDKGVTAASLWDGLKTYLCTEHKASHIIIRSHPSGELDGTQQLLRGLSACTGVELSLETLDVDLARSHTVIGYQSSIFSIAHKINRKILSYYPIQSLSPLLPHSYINYIPVVV